MIDDLDNALRRLLMRELPIHNGEVDIAFHQPRHEWSARLSRPTLNLFLYDIHEDSKRRALLPPWRQEEPVAHTVIQRRRPLYIQLRYAITAWTIEPEDEHGLLARTLLALHRFPELPAEVLSEVLRRQPGPITLEVAQPDGLPSPADFWSAMDNEIRPVLLCTVAMSLDPTTQFLSPLVTQRDLRFIDVDTGQSEGPGPARWAVRGYVRGLPPLRKVRARLVEREQEVEIGYEGQYLISGVPSGEYTLEIVVAGKAPVRQKLIVPAKSYDLELGHPPDLPAGDTTPEGAAVGDKAAADGAVADNATVDRPAEDKPTAPKKKVKGGS